MPTCCHIECDCGGCRPADRPQAPCRIWQQGAAGLQQCKGAQALRADLHSRPADGHLSDVLRLPLLALLAPHANLRAGKRGDLIVAC